ncbi:MAG TPA: hypothetical protein VNJ01_00060 [Bacteriovoracaceae bacterium]|nr:hypothetical protein [Bacteriovoracaceae bacterium]
MKNIFQVFIVLFTVVSQVASAKVLSVDGPFDSSRGSIDIQTYHVRIKPEKLGNRECFNGPDITTRLINGKPVTSFVCTIFIASFDELHRAAKNKYFTVVNSGGPSYGSDFGPAVSVPSRNPRIKNTISYGGAIHISARINFLCNDCNPSEIYEEFSQFEFPKGVLNGKTFSEFETSFTPGIPFPNNSGAGTGAQGGG